MAQVPRTPTHEYEDPLDRIWRTCAERVGLEVKRQEGAYAHSDGRGTLWISTPSDLDPDDSLAQMIFHELCHALVEGPASFDVEDWGLDNTSDDDEAREHACLRVQAWLARPLGLGTFFGATTGFRAFYDAIGPDPFEGEDPSVPLARRAAARVVQKPWAPHLQEALAATRDVTRALRSFVGPSAPPRSLWATVETETAPHDVGYPLPRPGARAASETCASCGFLGSRRGRAHCTKSERRTDATKAACERWEPALDCASCGACCREAFDVLELGPREAFVRKHRSLVVVRDGGARFDLPRPGGRCPPLVGDGSASAPYRCSVYEDRPSTCRTFAMGSAACLTARRRVGRSL